MKIMQSYRAALAAGMLALALMATPGWADTSTWSGGNGSVNVWRQPGNWLGGTEPTWGNTADIVFNTASGTNNLQTVLTYPSQSGLTIRSLTFNANADYAVRIAMEANDGTTSKTLTFASDTGTSTITVDPDATGNFTMNTTTTGGRIQLNNPLVIEHNGTGTLEIRRIRENSGNNYSLTKAGAGTLRYGSTAAFHYDGPTVINGGKVLVINATAGMAGGITVGGDSATGTPTLGGTGTIGGNVTIKAAGGGAAGTLAPGGDSSAGTLSLNGTNSLTLESGAKLAYRLGTASDSVTNVSTLALNGQVWSDFTFTAESGFGAGTYVLVEAASVSGSLGGSVSGSIESYTGTLSVDGNSDLILTVSGGTPTPVIIAYSVVGGQLVLDWPAGQGWQLQAQTNAVGTGLTTNWLPVTGATPPYTNAIDPANGSVFYRLVYP